MADHLQLNGWCSERENIIVIGVDNWSRWCRSFGTYFTTTVSRTKWHYIVLNVNRIHRNWSFRMTPGFVKNTQTFLRYAKEVVRENVSVGPLSAIWCLCIQKRLLLKVNPARPLIVPSLLSGRFLGPWICFTDFFRVNIFQTPGMLMDNIANTSSSLSNVVFVGCSVPMMIVI